MTYRDEIEMPPHLVESGDDMTLAEIARVQPPQLTEDGQPVWPAPGENIDSALPADSVKPEQSMAMPYACIIAGAGSLVMGFIALGTGSAIYLNGLWTKNAESTESGLSLAKSSTIPLAAGILLIRIAFIGARLEANK